MCSLVSNEESDNGSAYKGVIMDKSKVYVKKSEYLTKEDIELIKQLEKVCIDHDNAVMKLELDYKYLFGIGAKESTTAINEYMYYYDNRLIGYIGSSDFSDVYVEVMGLVDPEYRRQGIFSELMEMVIHYMNQHLAYKSILILSDRLSESGKGFIHSLNVSLHHCEYEMYYHEKNALANSSSAKNINSNSVGGDVVNNCIIHLVKATNKDAKEIAMQNRIYFDDVFDTDQSIENSLYKEEKLIYPEEEEKKGMLIFMALHENEVIGKVNIQISNSLGGIYGLGVKPGYRSKGYGRQILKLAITELQHRECSQTMLQVEAENEHALNMYKDCGFVTTSTMEYWLLKS